MGGFGWDGNIEEGGYIAGGQLVVGQYGKKGWRRVLITRGRNGTATTRHFSSTVLNFGVPATIQSLCLGTFLDLLDSEAWLKPPTAQCAGPPI